MKSWQKFDVQVVKRVLDSGNYTQGVELYTLEAYLYDFFGKPACVVDNGTNAIALSLILAGVKPGDDVLVPGFTFQATALAVFQVGANPILVDVKRDDFTIDVLDCEKKITPNTAAVISVDLDGRLADGPGLTRFCRRHKIPLIQDACPAAGTLALNPQKFLYGDFTCLSFNQTKIVGVSEGGAILSSNDDLIERAGYLRNFGEVNPGVTRRMSKLRGYNFKLDEITCALIYEQVNRLSLRAERAADNAVFLHDLVQGMGFSYPIPDDYILVPHKFRIFGGTRDDKKEVSPLCYHPFMGDVDPTKTPIANSVLRTSFIIGDRQNVPWMVSHEWIKEAMMNKRIVRQNNAHLYLEES